VLPISPSWGGVRSSMANVSQLERSKKVVCPKSPKRGGGRSSSSKSPFRGI